MVNFLRNLFGGRDNGDGPPADQPKASGGKGRAPIRRDNVTRLQEIAVLGGPDDPDYHDGRISWLNLSADGTRLASAGYNDFALWDTTQGKRLFHSSANYRYTALSADGAYFAGSGAPKEREIDILDASSGALLHQITTEKERVFGLAFSPDGRWLVASYYPTSQIVLYAVPEWQRIFSLPLQYICMGLAFTQDGQRLALSCSQEINPTRGTWAEETHICRVEDESISPIFKIEAGHEYSSFSPDGNLLAIGGKIYDPLSGGLIRDTRHNSFSFSGDGQLALLRVTGPVPVWMDIETGQVAHKLPPHPPGLAAHCVSADGTVLATTHGGSLPGQKVASDPFGGIRLWAAPA